MFNGKSKSKLNYRIIAVAIVLMLIFVLPACAGNNDNGQSVNNVNSQQKKKEEPQRQPHPNALNDPGLTITPSPTYSPISEDNICENKTALYDALGEWEITVLSLQKYDGELPESEFPFECFGDSAKDGETGYVFLLLTVEFYVIKREAAYSETEHYISDITLVEANNMDQYVDLSYIQAIDSTVGRSENKKDFYKILMSEGDRGKACLGFYLPEALAQSSELYLSVGPVTIPESVQYIPLSDLLDVA